jgi:hypothetical protein
MLNLKKAIITSLTTVLLVGGLASGANKDLVIEKYDKFKNHSLLITNSFAAKRSNCKRGCGEPLFVSAWFIQKPGKAPDFVFFRFRSISKEWRFLRAREFNLLADGRPYNLGMAEHEGNVGLYSVSEVLNVPVDPFEFLEIANAGIIEARLGGFVFNVDPHQVLHFKALANRLQTVLEETENVQSDRESPERD